MAQEFPLTFEEAIQFARKFRVRYLWIDSLCIIQGDDEDWKREAMSMGDVYSNSLLNLSATAAGPTLISPRHVIEPCIVESQWKGQQSISYVVTDFRFWEDRIYRSVCNQRAWITQERWLSPRVLHFTFDQLVWECRELEASETFPHGLPKEVKLSTYTGFKQNILATYGRSEVTFEKDRLVAIKGVAEKFSEILNDEWIAGLWKKTLPGDLMWNVRKGMRTNKPAPEPDIVERTIVGARPPHQTSSSSRLESYQAPSWSWASVLGDIDCGIYCSQNSEDCMIEVLEIVTSPLDCEQPHGRLKYAHLKLRGTLYPLAMVPPDWPPADQLVYLRLPPTIYIAGLPKKKEKPLWEGGFEREAHTLQAFIHPDEPVEYADIGRSCFLPVAKTVIRRPGHEFDGHRLVHGLCLLPAENQGEYQRIGIMEFGNDRCGLFLDGLKAQKSEERPTEIKAHPLTLDGSLYLNSEIGVFSIV
ncbi:hypothetical protein BDZ45DRAFT_805077 [Acephala macrosclerotiorum]|nr:hypothetical protein BDZ45DRAFT_805077 [Acephala macrosclerotiorum]